MLFKCNHFERCNRLIEFTILIFQFVISTAEFQIVATNPLAVIVWKQTIDWNGGLKFLNGCLKLGDFFSLRFSLLIRTLTDKFVLNFECFKYDRLDMIGQNLSKPETVISKRITRICKFSYNYNPTVFSNGQRGMAIK